jgi:hypothetical protein
VQAKSDVRAMLDGASGAGRDVVSMQLSDGALEAGNGNDARLGIGCVSVESDCEMQQAPGESSERQCRAGQTDDTG